MFRLIGIETFPYPNNLDVRSNNMSSEQKLNMDIQKARYHSIMKVLKPNCTFWFYEGYKKEDGKYQRTEEATPDDFIHVVVRTLAFLRLSRKMEWGKAHCWSFAFV